MAASLAALASAPVRLAAQGRTEFIPFVGLYLPAGNVVEESGVALKHNTTFVFGVRLALRATDRVGVEGSIGYTPSAVTFSATGIGSADTAAHVILASGRVRFGVGPRTASTSWHVLVGMSVVAHGGDAYDLLKSFGGSLSGATDIGMVVGAGGKFKVGSSLAVRVDVEDNLYSAKFKLGGANSQSKFQNDVVVSMGLVVRLGGK